MKTVLTLCLLALVAVAMPTNVQARTCSLVDDSCDETDPNNGAGEHWNEWYLNRYGRPYDDDYKGRNWNNGGGRHHGSKTVCMAADSRGRSAKIAHRSARKARSLALQVCREQSSRPRTCQIRYCN